MPKSSSHLFIAIDQGGQSSRVALYDIRGQQLAIFSAACATHSYIDLHGAVCVEQNGDEILAGIRDGLHQLETFIGDDVSRIKAAGFAGQGSSLLCWNRQTGAALSPILSWQDRRGEALLNDLPLDQLSVRKVTGLRISPHYGASKMRWCLNHLPAVQQAAASDNLSIGPIVSFLFAHLLGKQDINIDPGHAQRTLLWNLTDNNWDKNLLDVFSLTSNVLPTCRWHNSDFGHLILGSHTVPLLSSQRDQGASLFARGMPERAACYVNIGTGPFIQRITEQLNAPEGLLVSPLWFPEPTTGTKKFYAWEATVNGAASALTWLADSIGAEQIKPADIEHALTITAADSLYMLNAVGGLSAPWWRTDLTSRFSADCTPAEKILAWIESVIFQIAVNVALMQTDEVVQKIYISGGLSRAAGVCQRLADITGIHVLRSENADATLQGIAFTAAGMPENWNAHSSDKIFTPNVNHALQRRFSHWNNAMNEWLR